MDEPVEARDFFVSYTQPDRAWAEWLAWELEAGGYTTLLQAWDMPAGTAFVHVMDQAVQHTRHTLLVLSPAYLRSAMGEAEWRPAFLADPSGQHRRLVPVRVEDCRPPGLLADRVWIDLVGLDEAGARSRLREEVSSALRGHARPATRPRFPATRTPTPAVDRPRFPTALPPVWNVPYRRNPAFHGRQELIGGLADQRRGRSAPVPRALQAGAGVGKTALAVEYAYRYRSAFDTVWWVRAEEPATLVGDYADLAAALGVSGAGQTDQQLMSLAVRRWLEEHDRWLLVFDNAEAPDTATGLKAPLDRLADLLPLVPQGQLLLTSRDASWDRYMTLAELEVFSPEEAVAFLLDRSGGSDAASAAKIADLLGLLPLALEQAGAYLRETRLSLAGYLDRLRQYPALTLSRGRPRDRDPADTVATTWQVSLERVRPTTRAVELLEVCIFMGPEEIPRELFGHKPDLTPGALDELADDPFLLDDAIAALHRFGLAKAGEQGLTLHRLLQQVVRHELDPVVAAARVGTAVRLLHNALPFGGRDDPSLWPVCARLLPHVLATTGHAVAHQAEPLTTADLLEGAADYLHGRARYGDARVLYERALAIREAELGGHHVTTARSLDNLANVLVHLGELADARALHERALRIRESSLGADHPDTAQSLNNLANVLADLDDLDTARTLYERALQIREVRLGPDHPATANSLSNLASVLRDQGDSGGARSLYERALVIFEARLGVDHPATAQSLSNLASVLRDQGDSDGARPLYERAVAILEARLGVDHPATAQGLDNLASVLRDQGDLDGARPLYERAVTVFEARLGSHHPATAQCRKSLADVVTLLRRDA
jgi:tetratricopeptide (TPR) repeat protein